MNLKSLLPNKENGSDEYYWAVVVEPEWVQAGIWEIKDNKAQIVSVSPPAAWGSREELAGACDTVLSAAVQSFPEEAKEPSKTVFGVSSAWVSEGQIKPEHLKTLKQVCSDLSLTPVGFVVLPEVIAHFIKSEEGAPLSGVALGISSENIEISIFRLGNLVGTTNVARSVSVADDLAEGLAKFASGDPLPSRFLLYDGKEGELENVKQNLIKAHWDDYEKIKLLHTPKVEIITPERKIHAVSLAGASEIAGISSLAVLTKKVTEKVEKGEVAESESLTVPETPVRPEDVGFVVGQDVAMAREEKPQREEKQTRSPTELKEKLSFGILEKLKAKTMSIFSKTKMPGLREPGRKRVFMIGGGFFLLILLVGFILWWYLPRAIVTIYVSPKKLDEKITIFMDPEVSSPNLTGGILPGQVIRTTVSSERTKSTTGTKTVGEKARGTVEIRNGTGEDIELSTGIILVSNNDLQFSLTESVSVSAGSSTTSPGTATVEVVASDIGVEYNLAKDEGFTVGNYPKVEVEAIATSDFSGGSSRQISAVSVEDQNELESDLTNELLDEAKEELATNTNENEFFIEESVTATSSARSFDNKVGDEADSLKLSLSLDASGLVVGRTALADYAKEVLKDKVPSGFVLREDQIDMHFEFEEEEDGVYELTAYLDVNLLPEVKPDEIAERIAGKYAPLAKDYLTAIPGFSRAEIDLKPNLPGRLGTLPHVVSKIEIELTAER